MDKKSIVINKVNNLVKKHYGLLNVGYSTDIIDIDYHYNIYVNFRDNEVFGKYNSLNNYLRITLSLLEISNDHFKAVLKSIRLLDKELSKLNR